MINRYGKRITSALGIVVIVCLGIRVSDWLITPVLPVLGALCVVVAVLLLLLRR